MKIKFGIKAPKEKISLVQWNKGDHKEHFGHDSKSIKGKERLREKGFMVFGLIYTI